MGLPLACVYAIYYCLRKRSMYASQITPMNALKATFRGIRENKITKQRALGKENQ